MFFILLSGGAKLMISRVFNRLCSVLRRNLFIFVCIALQCFSYTFAAGLSGQGVHCQDVLNLKKMEIHIKGASTGFFDGCYISDGNKGKGQFGINSEKWNKNDTTDIQLLDPKISAQNSKECSESKYVVAYGEQHTTEESKENYIALHKYRNYTQYHIYEQHCSKYHHNYDVKACKDANKCMNGYKDAFGSVPPIESSIAENGGDSLDDIMPLSAADATWSSTVSGIEKQSCSTTFSSNRDGSGHHDSIWGESGTSSHVYQGGNIADGIKNYNTLMIQGIQGRSDCFTSADNVHLEKHKIELRINGQSLSSVSIPEDNQKGYYGDYSISLQGLNNRDVDRLEIIVTDLDESLDTQWTGIVFKDKKNTIVTYPDPPRYDKCGRVSDNRCSKSNVCDMTTGKGDYTEHLCELKIEKIDEGTIIDKPLVCPDANNPLCKKDPCPDPDNPACDKPKVCSKVSDAECPLPVCPKGEKCPRYITCPDPFNPLCPKCLTCSNGSEQCSVETVCQGVGADCNCHLPPSSFCKPSEPPVCEIAPIERRSRAKDAVFIDDRNHHTALFIAQNNPYMINKGPNTKCWSVNDYEQGNHGILRSMLYKNNVYQKNASWSVNRLLRTEDPDTRNLHTYDTFGSNMIELRSNKLPVRLKSLLEHNQVRQEAIIERLRGTLKSPAVLQHISSKQVLFSDTPIRKELYNMSTLGSMENLQSWHSFYDKHVPTTEHPYGRYSTVALMTNAPMLHLFDANSGKEVFGFIPNSLLEYVKSSAALNDGRVLFDGSMTSKIIHNQQRKEWSKILAGSTGKLGNSVFAIDITKPRQAKVLWEINHFNGIKMGAAVPDPIIIQANNNQWYVVVSSGYYVANETPYLLLIDIESQDTITIKMEKSLSGTNTSNYTRGLSSPKGFDHNNDGKTDYIYVGDLKGDLWRINLLTNNPQQWGTEKVKVFDSQSVNTQPVYMQPSFYTRFALSPEQTKDVLVIFGTGMPEHYRLEGRALSSQYIYAVRDMFLPQDSKNKKEYLTKLDKLSSVIDVQDKKRGWYAPLPKSYVMNSAPIIRDEVVYLELFGESFASKKTCDFTVNMKQGSILAKNGQSIVSDPKLYQKIENENLPVMIHGLEDKVKKSFKTSIVLGPVGDDHKQYIINADPVVQSSAKGLEKDSDGSIFPPQLHFEQNGSPILPPTFYLKSTSWRIMK